jgi:hypothetical protein
MRDTGSPAGAKRDQDKAGSDRNEFRVRQQDTSHKISANASTSIMATRFPAVPSATSVPSESSPRPGNIRARRFSSPCASAQLRSYLAARLSAFESCIDERSNRIGSASYALRERVRPSTSSSGQRAMGLRSSAAAHHGSRSALSVEALGAEA